MKRIFAFFLALSSGACLADCAQVKLHNSVEHNQLWADISYLASEPLEGRKTQTLGAERARAFIQQRFQSMGLLPLPQQSDFTLSFSFESGMSSVEGINVGGYVRGTHYPDRYLVVTAHYDHLGKKGRHIYPGADDNASGVAAMLSLAKVVKSAPLQHSVVFLATDGEEKGLYGSKAFLADRILAHQTIGYNLNLDMLAQGGRRNRLYASASRLDKRLDDLIDETIEQAGLCLVNGHRSTQRSYSSTSKINWKQASDHGSFAKAKIPYVFIGVSDHPDYHTPQDTVENIRPEFFYAAVETSLMVLRKLDALQ